MSIRDALKKRDDNFAVPDTPNDKLFGSTEIIHDFVEYTGWVFRKQVELPRQIVEWLRVKNDSNTFWHGQFGGKRGLKPVNDHINNHKAFSYVPDAWDTWKSPGKFFRDKGGDCEDYAVAKYAALKFLGWSDPLRIVIVKDISKREGRNGHCVLASYTDGKIMILDNVVKEVADSRAKVFKNYRALYSMDDENYWVHF